MLLSKSGTIEFVSIGLSILGLVAGFYPFLLALTLGWVIPLVYSLGRREPILRALERSDVELLAMNERQLLYHLFIGRQSRLFQGVPWYRLWLERFALRYLNQAYNHLVATAGEGRLREKLLQAFGWSRE